jgi:uncharacterized membrane protein YeaQ/YmgE (transglycosylase-associated protein family)
MTGILARESRAAGRASPYDRAKRRGENHMDGQTVATIGGVGLLVMLAIFLAIGLAIGALARWALPGADTMGLGRTMLYGVGGSMLGGIVSNLLGVNNTLISLAIAVAVAAGLIWFFTRRVPKKP